MAQKKTHFIVKPIQMAPLKMLNYPNKSSRVTLKYSKILLSKQRVDQSVFFLESQIPVVPNNDICVKEKRKTDGDKS